MAPTAEFCGIDPEEMGQLATSLCGAADRLTAFSQEFEGKLRQHGISTPALREIADIADWGGTQVSMLHGRIDLIKALGDGAPELGGGGGRSSLVRLPDELEDFETARGLANMYGNDILVNHGGEFQATLIHEHADEVAQLAKNPQAAAAFFALLPAGIRDSLPSRIARTGSKTAKQDLAAFSAALGAALRAPTFVPAFAKVRNELVKPTDKTTAWNRLALLKGANAPSGVRSAAARALALDGFTKDPRQDRRAVGPTESKAYGYSSDLVAMGLEVLAGDGAAVRDAFSKMGGTDVKLSQVDKMKQFLGYAQMIDTGDEVADAFGRVLEAGTEATTEKPGRHSPAAAAFALDAIKAMGPFGDGLPTVTKDSMVTIAKSYIHELASGARFDKAVDRASGVGVPENWITLPGLAPAFYLSPGDTHRFLKTFVGDKRLTDDFDATAAHFRHDTLKAAARLDTEGGTRHFERTARAFGDFAGLEFKATLDVRGERDATNDLIIDITKNTLALGIDRIPLVGPLADEGVKAGWELAKAYGISTALDGWADSFETRVEEVTGTRSDFVLRQKYDMAHILHEAGYPASEPPAELISKSTGDLKTYDELLAEAKREAGEGKKWEQMLGEKLTPYERWMDSNGKFDDKVEDASNFQTSEQAKEQIRLWG
ncbi:hypothetical protein [Streptosporangium roseum]|uniref:Uncharacterized protein n=1 Tax=Streptosporangium roseum (strain ATCC 12428 / DSM 43021 / JCM 3005 / KCTC 9067 / NCIMB 10171 / NRRL 2505 / NI 9100) TaxID=479432 RepID=D2B0G7_STRRD|nr:hypothetical protein [Streptosporangium roseum]ACZ89173.1 hypothetical protein Sros_6459 [Streptosporangium roseum DSM 43021]